MLLVVVLGRQVTAALVGHDVHADGTFARQLHSVGQGVFERLDVVAGHRTHIAHPECLEERGRLEEFAHGRLEGLHALFGLWPHDRQLTQEVFDLALTPNVHGVHADVGEGVAETVGDAPR